MNLTRRLAMLEQQTAKRAPTAEPPCRLVLDGERTAAVQAFFAGIGENIPTAQAAGPLALVSWCDSEKEDRRRRRS